ncbi:MAG: nucleoside phosphorylase [Anaerolineaceae bacterium]|nr:nucleoside phosphorylase [Anaerolineaceae bacterium]
MIESEFPILEFDPAPSAILQPHAKALPGGTPRRAVLCFFQDVLTELAGTGQLHPVGHLVSEIGKNVIYEFDGQQKPILVIHPGVGAALAVGFMEELIGMGVRQLIACGGCGVLKSDMAAGHAVVLSSAVRDEGTSYHYLPPGREVSASPAAVAILEQVLQEHNLPFETGKSWTTDGLYRETQAKRDRRLAEGCLVVEMEAAAFFAVAQFRQVTFGQVVYGGDLVVPEGWDKRSWDRRTNVRQALFRLAVEACQKLGD